MAQYRIDGHGPQVDGSAYVAEEATVIAGGA